MKRPGKEAFQLQFMQELLKKKVANITVSYIYKYSVKKILIMHFMLAFPYSLKLKKKGAQ